MNVLAALATLAVLVVPGGPVARPGPLRTSFGDGTWTVGRGIAPGTYYTHGATALPPRAVFSSSISCYWVRYRDFPPGPHSALASDIVAGPDIVTVLPTDAAFQAQDCGTWRPLPRSGPRASTIGQGVYAVGTDIAPGTYTTTGRDRVLGEEGGSLCYWARLRAFTGTPGAVIEDGYPSGPARVTIMPSDRGFETQGCNDWEK